MTTPANTATSSPMLVRAGTPNAAATDFAPAMPRAAREIPVVVRVRPPPTAHPEGPINSKKDQGSDSDTKVDGLPTRVFGGGDRTEEPHDTGHWYRQPYVDCDRECRPCDKKQDSDHSHQRTDAAEEVQQRGPWSQGLGRRALARQLAAVEPAGGALTGGQGGAEGKPRHEVQGDCGNECRDATNAPHQHVALQRSGR